MDAPQQEQVTFLCSFAAAGEQAGVIYEPRFPTPSWFCDHRDLPLKGWHSPEIFL